MSGETEVIFQKIRDEKDVFVKAKHLKNLNHDHGLRIKDIAKTLGKQSSYICHLLRLINIPEIIVDGYYASQISISHLFIISRLTNHESMIKVYEEVLAGNFTVAQTEEKVREALYQVKTEGTFLTPDEKEIFVKKFKEHIGASDIKITQTRIKSSLNLIFKGSLKKTTPILREILRIISEFRGPENS